MFRQIGATLSPYFYRKCALKLSRIFIKKITEKHKAGLRRCLALSRQSEPFDVTLDLSFGPGLNWRPFEVQTGAGFGQHLSQTYCGTVTESCACGGASKESNGFVIRRLHCWLVVSGCTCVQSISCCCDLSVSDILTLDRQVISMSFCDGLLCL